MNGLPSKKYGIKPEEPEQKCLGSEAYKERFDFRLLKKILKGHNRLTRYEQKIYDKKKTLKLRSPLKVGEEILILSSRLKKKDSAGKFFKSSVYNRPYFNKQKTFSVTDRQLVDEKYFHWLKPVENDKKLNNRFPREEIYSLTDSFK